MAGSGTGGRTVALGGDGLSTAAFVVRPPGPACRLVRLGVDRDLDGEVVADRFQFPALIHRAEIIVAYATQPIKRDWKTNWKEAGEYQRMRL